MKKVSPLSLRSKVKTCLGCYYQKDNKCYWFESPKLIPNETLYKGCKFRKDKFEKVNTTKLVLFIIDKFDGEVI